MRRLLLIAALALALPATVLAQEIQLKSPRLEVYVPFVEFSQGIKESGGVTVPYLAQYIVGVYKFLLTIVGVLASVMLAVGGFQYLTSGGDKTRIEVGKKRIQNALVGMILAFGSYALLYAINPQLVTFQALTLASVETSTLDFRETGVYASHTEEAKARQPVPASAGSSDLDKLFDAYSACVGLHPAILKAIAFAESGLKPSDNLGTCSDAKGNCYIGLYQLYRPYCEDRVKEIKQRKLSYLSSVLDDADDCTEQNRADAEVNVALYALKAASNLEGIVSKCGKDLSLKDFILTLYVHHNNGPGVGKYIVSHALEGGCGYVGEATDYDSCKKEDGKDEGMRKWVRSFYETKGTPLKGKKCDQEKLRDYGEVTDATKSYGCITADYGEVKMCYGFKMVNLVERWAPGVASPFVPKDPSKCPFDLNRWVLPRG